MAVALPGQISGTEEESSSKSMRLHYLDWVRVMAVVGVFLYHASRPFVLQEWLINDEQQSTVITLVYLVFLGSFGMPLFFLVSGAGTYFALHQRTGRQYAQQRVRRLLIPFVVGGRWTAASR